MWRSDISLMCVGFDACNNIMHVVLPKGFGSVTTQDAFKRNQIFGWLILCCSSKSHHKISSMLSKLIRVVNPNMVCIHYPNYDAECLDHAGLLLTDYSELLQTVLR